MKHSYLLILLSLFWWGCETTVTYEMVIKNANIYTVNEAQPKAEAVAIQDGKITFVGSNEEIEQFIGEQTQVLDLGGKTMTPGLVESHAHFLGVGYNRLNLDLSQTQNFQEIVDMVAKAAAKAKPGEWITGRGWHQSKWNEKPAQEFAGFPTHHQLSEVSPDNPVFLKHASGHAGFANAKAMEVSGVRTVDPENIIEEVEGGEVFRDEVGNPTGMFNETAQGLISKHIPTNTEETHRKAIALAVEECLQHGITSFHDAGEGPLAISTFKKVMEEGDLKVRLYVMLSSRDSTFLKEWFAKGPEIGLGDNFLTVRSVKLYVDGALGARGAWLLKPYSDHPDDPNHTGHEVTPMNYAAWVTEKGLVAGFQICSHAIGDRANREVLDMYETALGNNPGMAKNHRFRIEHAQHISGEDIPRFGQMGVIPAMQAIHMSSDRPWAVHRLGIQRIEEGAYVWKKLLQTGAKVINGTDAPVEPISPIASFYASVTRKTLKGQPEGGYEPSQRMSRVEALKSYTLDAAYGAFEEEIKGSIEVGKLADFAIYNQDLMTIPEDQLLTTEVDMTIVNGEVVYEKE